MVVLLGFVAVFILMVIGNYFPLSLISIAVDGSPLLQDASVSFARTAPASLVSKNWLLSSS